MNLPNFFIIGAAKSGTSSLYWYLKQHPEIYMSPVKEPHFFSFDDKSKMTKGPGDPIPNAITDFNAYQRLFDDVSNEIAVGEASTSYLYRQEAAKRIHNLIPDAKLIALLRHPAERAFSAYMHVVRDGREVSENFAKALQLEEARKNQNWEPMWHFTSVGFYFEQLSRYYQCFDKEKIKVFLYDELVNDQQALIHKIFHFLEVDPTFKPDSSTKFNVSGTQKSQLLHTIENSLFMNPNPIRWVSRKLIPENWRWKATNWMRIQNLENQSISPRIRRELTDRFREDIHNLQTLIERDLSHWLE